MEYKVTTAHCHKHLGNTLKNVLHPWKSWQMWLYLAFDFAALGIVITFICLNSKRDLVKDIESFVYFIGLFFLLAIGGMGLWGAILVPFGVKETFRDNLAKKIKYLVNDPELLWLNFVRPKRTIQNNTVDWENENKARISETNLEVIAYLKLKGTSQGMHRVISGFQNSASANKHLSRMAEKGLIEHDGNDFCYTPWKFAIIDDFNNSVKDTELEKILSFGWERMLDEVGGKDEE